MNSINDKIDHLFSTFNTTNTPGCVVAVIRNGQFLDQKAYGMADLERHVPLSVTSIFDIASTSKQFTAAGILLLAEQGKLSPQDDVRAYLPELPDYGRKIRLHHLIHHTSGLRDYLTLMPLAGMRYENKYSLGEILALIFRQKSLNFSPGKKHLYCNSGYLLLGEIIRRVSATSLQYFFRDHIFRPLEMKNTCLYDDFTQIIANRAIGYAPVESGGYRLEMSNQDLVGDGGLLTNVEDLFHWDQNFYQNRLGKGSQKLIQQLLTPGQLNNGQALDYAFGLELGEHRGLKTVAHGGSWAGYRSEMVRFPDQQLTVICLSNLSSLEAPSLARQVAEFYLADLIQVGDVIESSPPTSTEESLVAAPKAKSKKIKKKIALELRGEYYSQELDVCYHIDAEDGQIRLKLGHSAIEKPLIMTAVDHYHLEDWLLSFTRGKKGGVNGFLLTTTDGQVKDLHFKKI